MSFLAMDEPRHMRMRSLGVTRFHAPQGGGAGGAGRRTDQAAPRRRVGAQGVRLHRRVRRQAADGRDLRAARRARGRPGPAACAGRRRHAPRGRRAGRATPGHRSGLELAALLRGHAGTATPPAQRRPGLGADGRGDRRRPPQRPGDHRFPVPDGRRRQRDHHQAARKRAVLGLAQPRRTRAGARRPRTGIGLDRGDPALRHVKPDHRAHGGHRPRLPRPNGA